MCLDVDGIDTRSYRSRLVHALSVHIFCALFSGSMVGWSTRPQLSRYRPPGPPQRGGVQRRRSRSPVAGSASQGPDLPGLRRDGPSRRASGHGAWRPLSPAERQQAVADLEADVYSASARGPQASRLRTIGAILESWSLPAYPPTPESLRALAASLKAGRYASAAAYLGTYKVEAERQGYAWPPSMLRALKDYTRSCERGRGGPVRARPLDLGRLSELPRGRSP